MSPRIIIPPEALPAELPAKSVFLAGTIDQGHSVDWQRAMIERLSRAVGAILNPRRPAWDETWEQKIENAEFRGQVEWELEALERCDLIVMWFAPGSRSPITLLELGLHARSGKLLVGCPRDFWRRGNVEITCARYGVPFVEGEERLVELALERLA